MAEEDYFGNIGQVLHLVLGSNSRPVVSGSAASHHQNKPTPVARIDDVEFPTKDLPELMDWRSYSSYVRGGGAPYIINYLAPRNSRMKPVVVIWRKMGQEIVELFGYEDMPLYIDDLIAVAPPFKLRVQFLLGGRFNLMSECVGQIQSAKDASIVQANFQFYKDELNRASVVDKTPIKMHTAGGIMGIQG